MESKFVVWYPEESSKLTKYLGIEDEVTYTSYRKCGIYHGNKKHVVFAVISMQAEIFHSIVWPKIALVVVIVPMFGTFSSVPIVHDYVWGWKDQHKKLGYSTYKGKKLLESKEIIRCWSSLINIGGSEILVIVKKIIIKTTVSRIRYLHLLLHELQDVDYPYNYDYLMA